MSAVLSKNNAAFVRNGGSMYCVTAGPGDTLIFTPYARSYDGPPVTLTKARAKVLLTSEGTLRMNGVAGIAAGAGPEVEIEGVNSALEYWAGVAKTDGVTAMLNVVDVVTIASMKHALAAKPLRAHAEALLYKDRTWTLTDGCALATRTAVDAGLMRPSEFMVSPGLVAALTTPGVRGPVKYLALEHAATLVFEDGRRVVDPSTPLPVKEHALYNVDPRKCFCGQDAIPVVEFDVEEALKVATQAVKLKIAQLELVVASDSPRLPLRVSDALYPVGQIDAARLPEKRHEVTFDAKRFHALLRAMSERSKTFVGDLHLSLKYDPLTWEIPGERLDFLLPMA